MHKLIVLFLFLSQFAYSQNSGIFRSFISDDDILPENMVFHYAGYDFSQLWLETPNKYVLGIIGKENQRIRVKVITVSRDDNNPLLYNVTGKSSVMGNVCDFKGTMRINVIREFIDNESKNAEIKERKSIVKRTGLLFGDYEFREDSTQQHVGSFAGQFASLWYLDTLGMIKYNQLYVIDNYFNNSFSGTWKNYEGNDERICVWADYDVPLEKNYDKPMSPLYMPERKYYKRGWQNYIKAYKDGDKNAMLEEEMEWWK